MGKPKILRGKSNKNVKESGCCFRSCGGAPVIQQDDSVKIYETSNIRKFLEKIK